MAITNQERVGRSLESLRTGLLTYIINELKAHYGEEWWTHGVLHALTATHTMDKANRYKEEPEEGAKKLDTQAILSILWNNWNEVFRHKLGHPERNLVSELRDVRNRWAHQDSFDFNDTYRALDSVFRLLHAVSAPEADGVDDFRRELFNAHYGNESEKDRALTTTQDIKEGHINLLTPTEERLLQSIEVFNKKGDWIAIDIICQLALGCNIYEIESNLRTSHPHSVNLKNVLTHTVDIMKQMGYEGYLDDITSGFILRQIDKIAGEILRNLVISKIESATLAVTNGLFLFSCIWSREPNQSNMELNKLYYATFSKDPAFDLTRELTALGIAYRTSISTKKHYYWYYKVPIHIEPILFDIDKYITMPKIVDTSSYLDFEKEENNLPRLHFIDIASRKIDSHYETITLKSNFDLLYPNVFDSVSYSKAGILYLDEYSKAFFSPVTFDELKKGIALLKKGMAEPLKTLFLKVFRSLEILYAPLAQLNLHFNDNLGAYIGTLDIGTRRPTGVFISPWLIWLEEKYFTEIRYDLDWIKNNLPCLIITSETIMPPIIRSSVLQGFKDISFISISESGNYLLTLPGQNQILSDLLPFFAEEGYSLRNVTDDLLPQMFPLSREEILDFANNKYTKDDLMVIASEHGINLKNSMLKIDMLLALSVGLELRDFARRMGYPVYDTQQSNG